MTKEKAIVIISKVIEWSIIVAIFLVPIYFAWFHENYTVFDLNKSALLRLCLSVAVIAYLSLIALRGSIPALGSKKLFWATTAFIISVSLSTIFSLQPIISLLGSYERQQGLQNIISYALLFLFIVYCFKSHQQLRRLFVILNISSTVICLYGLMQATGLDPLSWAESSMSRIFSTFGQPNFFGHYLVVIIPITLYSLFFQAKKRYQKMLYILLVLAELACLVFTYSRGAWIALVVSVFVSGIILLWKYNKKKYAVSIVVLVVLASIGLVLPPIRSAILKHSDYVHLQVSTRIISILDFSNGSNAIRFKYWGAALQSMAEAGPLRDLIGFGPDTQSSVFAQYYQSDWGYYEQLNSFPDRAHNSILDLLLQFGLLGLGTFLYLVFVCLRGLKRLLKTEHGERFYFALTLSTSIIAYTVNNFFSFSLTAMSVILFTLLAISWRAANSDDLKTEKLLHFFQPLSRWTIVVAISILLGIIFYSFDVRPLIADYFYIQVKKGEARQDCRMVLDNIENVLEWYPISHYYARAYLSHTVNCLSAITSDASRQKMYQNILDQAQSIPVHEEQFYTLVDLAHAYSILGYYDNPTYYEQAEKYYLEMLAISKNITVSYQDYGRMKMWQGDFSQARGLFKQGIAITPTLDNALPNSEHTTAIATQLGYFHDLIALTYYQEKNFAQAKSEYIVALKFNPTMTSSLKNLADIAYQEHDLQKAIQYNKQAFALEPQEALWPVSLATLYKELGNIKQARMYAEQAAALDSSNENVKKLIKELNK